MTISTLLGRQLGYVEGFRIHLQIGLEKSYS